MTSRSVLCPPAGKALQVPVYLAYALLIWQVASGAVQPEAGAAETLGGSAPALSGTG